MPSRDAHRDVPGSALGGDAFNGTCQAGASLSGARSALPWQGYRRREKAPTMTSGITELMKTAWPTRFAENVRDLRGLSDRQDAPVPDRPRDHLARGRPPLPRGLPTQPASAGEREGVRLKIDRIMQYSPIPGEATLVDAVLGFSNAIRSRSTARTSSSRLAASTASTSPAASSSSPATWCWSTVRPLPARWSPSICNGRASSASTSRPTGPTSPGCDGSWIASPAKETSRNSSTSCQISRTPPASPSASPKGRLSSISATNSTSRSSRTAPTATFATGARPSLPSSLSIRNGTATTSSVSTPFRSSSVRACGSASTSARPRSSNG